MATTDAPDLLHELKEVERAIRAKALSKMLAQLKEKAHEILELKEYTNAVLEELGVEDADCKRLIDWINSLEQVKLSKKDKEKIHEDAKDDVRTERKEAEKRVDLPPTAFIGYSQTTGTSLAAYNTLTSSAPLNWVENKTPAFNWVNPTGATMKLTSGSSSLAVNLK